MRPESDEALNVLRSTHERLKLSLPWQLVEQAYSIERELQFEHDRDVPIDRLRKLVSVYVELEFGDSQVEPNR
jgi:hypothetical protein